MQWHPQPFNQESEHWAAKQTKQKSDHLSAAGAHVMECQVGSPLLAVPSGSPGWVIKKSDLPPFHICDSTFTVSEDLAWTESQFLRSPDTQNGVL